VVSDKMANIRLQVLSMLLEKDHRESAYYRRFAEELGSPVLEKRQSFLEILSCSVPKYRLFDYPKLRTI